MQQIENLIVWTVMNPWNALCAAGMIVLIVIALVSAIWLDYTETDW